VLAYSAHIPSCRHTKGTYPARAVLRGRSAGTSAAVSSQELAMPEAFAPRASIDGRVATTSLFAGARRRLRGRDGLELKCACRAGVVRRINAGFHAIVMAQFTRNGRVF